MNRVRICAGLLLLAASLTVSGCTTPFQTKDTMNSEPNETKPASELFRRMLDVSQETVGVHGGQWTYSGEARKPWDVENPSGFLGERCAGSDTEYRYVNLIFGPAVDDPEAAVEKYVAHFAEQGFTEVNRYDAKVPAEVGTGYYTIVSLEDEEGTTLIYQAGNHLSSLSVEGSCTDDPAMQVRT